ncbi:hypothetical protein, partial [Ilumatobacter sp.]|uniref:hypothetical protein n=1 Tax=Ilumatobacter sp. TaxID=1967498 RepID=UPI003752C59D
SPQVVHETNERTGGKSGWCALGTQSRPFWWSVSGTATGFDDGSDAPQQTEGGSPGAVSLTDRVGS